MLLNSFIENDIAKQSLLGALASGRLSHGILICGEKGFGVNYFAKLLACDITNTSFQDIENSQSELVQVVTGEGASGQIKIDSIRQINQSTSFSQIQGKNRVIIIQNCENFNAGSANALLKNLEEPAEGVTYILTTNKPWSILPTIRSRCTIYTLQQPTNQACREYFEKLNSDMDIINSLINIYQGNIGIILEVCSNNKRYEILQKAIEGFSYIQSKDGYNLSKLCFTFNKKKEEFVLFLQDLEFIAKNNINNQSIKLLKTINYFNNILNFNVNLNLVLENFSFKAIK